ncbi:MAG: hypothetical protein KKE62_04560 [Proteobacteria bacterium]|nr:hypothetical protein [Pseudomonadota bacterium]MBU1388034.1 hypothetical protein [Pseudomonadota bacterium]MBU1542097.1 hypothetical protein [Pseudomonadota bacterium]MBU2429280.1 hypothetical protein [Pseudomonadota bacterium]MBU2482881.1 hypothetical protein [Pseudomonadota bacterium]
MKKIDTFIDAWAETESKTRQAFIEIYTHLKTLENTTLEFNERPGVSYSLRPKHTSQKNRSLFAMVDVIDDDPDERWLSVCFYGEMITDPDEAGDLIPEGLLGEDGYCFDLYEYDTDEIDYLKQRLTQAHKNARE